MLSADAQSVLPNGDFEQADPAHPGKPAHWDLPDGLGVQWTDAPAVAGAPPHGKAIRIDTSVSEIDVVASYAKAGLTQWVFPHPQGNAIAETYGLSLYSEAVPIAPGKTYRVTFDYLAEKGTAAHAYCHAPANSTQNGGHLQLVRNYSAVTAACMLTRRDLFEQVGGFDEMQLPVTYNDVDYCLKLRQAGFLVVYTPFAQLRHYESASRGRGKSDPAEGRLLRQRWPAVIAHDPYGNPNLAAVHN